MPVGALLICAGRLRDGAVGVAGSTGDYTTSLAWDGTVVLAAGAYWVCLCPSGAKCMRPPDFDQLVPGRGMRPRGSPGIRAEREAR